MRNGIVTEIPIYDFVNDIKLPVSVKREHWNKGSIIGGTYHRSIREMNNLLAKVEFNVKDAVYELIEKKVQISRENIIKLTYINEQNAQLNEKKIADGKIIVNEDGGAFASHDEFEDFIASSEDPKFDSLKKSMGIYKRESILDFWDGFIKDFAPSSYNSPRYAIADYIKRTGDDCKANKYSKEWLYRFFDNIINEGYSWNKDGTNRKNYTISTITKYSKHLRLFGDYLFSELEILDNQDYRRFSLRKRTKKTSLIKYQPIPFNKTHSLMKSEFDLFYNFKFSDPKLELARDMFIMQVWLGGLRSCDFYKLSTKNFHKNSNGNYFVSFNQQKTDGDVINFVNQNYLDALLEKYATGFDSFFEVHQYNKMLKKAAKVAALKRELSFRNEVAKDSKATYEWFPIYEKITNSWARNCAVSILCELGQPNDFISKFIGHRDQKMINHYKTIYPKEVTKMLSEVKPENTTTTI